MDLTFELGNRSQPRGHTFVYFRSVSDPSRVLATYVVVTPITLDFAKYVPPMFAGQIPAGGLEGMNAFPIPPIPEAVESERWLRAIAEARGDDLIVGGTIDDSRPDQLLMVTAEVAKSYSDLYRAYASTIPIEEQPAAEIEDRYDVQDLFYQVMTEPELIGEIVKLTGKLRYAVEGQDEHLTHETVREMERISSRLPEKYRIPELIESAKIAGERGRKLSELLIERDYRILREQYAGLEDVERQIRELQEGE